MPSSAAASRFCEQARSARPMRVRLKNSCEREHHHGAAAENPEQLVADRDRPDLQRAAGGEFRIGARLVAQREDHHLLDQQLHGERRENDGEQRRVAPPHRIDHEDLHQHADAGDQDGGENRRQPHRQAVARQQRVREHAAEHDEHALREIDDAAGVVDDAEADADEAVDQADADAVDEALDQFDDVRHRLFLHAEIGGDHVGMGLDLVRRAFGDLACRNRAPRCAARSASPGPCRARSAAR